MLSWSLLLVIGNWVIRIGMTPIVMRRRRPTDAMVWLLVIYFQPWIGLLVYLLIGENRLPRRRIRKRFQARRGWTGEAAVNPHIVQPLIDPEQRPLITLAERLGRMPILGGNHIDLLTETDDVINSMIADIDAAKRHAHLEFYLFEDDRTGWRVAEALVRAVERGVTCRVLVDDVGSWNLSRDLGPWMTEHGVNLYEMLPVNPFRRRLARMDLRNHRKIMVVDGAIGYAGSQNIVDPTYGPKKLTWYDMTIRVIGPAVSQLQSIFAEDWFLETHEALRGTDIFPDPEVAGDVPIQALPSGPIDPTTEGYQRLVVAALYAAKERVIITSPYLVPDEPFMQALQVAVMRGVKVELVVPRKSDQRVTDAAGRAYHRHLLDAGVILHLHQVGLLHAKTMTVDDAFALIGSGNFDIRSFYLNFEVNLLLYGPEITARLRFAQRYYMSQSTRLTLSEWNGRSAPRRLLDDAAKLFSPLL